MGWFMPSYKRPHRMLELMDAPGGWPFAVAVLVNQDQIAEYNEVICSRGSPWWLVPIPEDSFCADAHRLISIGFPNESFYGLLMDDLWPVTPGWNEKLVEAAGRRHIAIANGKHSGFPTNARGAMCLGGDLVRAMGSLVPVPVSHYYEDNIWDAIGETHGLLRPVADAIVDHRHYMQGTAPKDETYDRSQVHVVDDAKAFAAWQTSDARKAMDARIAKC